MSYVGKITKGSATHLVGSTLYGTCDTAAGTAAKVVACPDFDALITGVTIHVKFTYSNTAANATLNVNSTGAKNLCSYGTTRVGTTEKTSWKAGAVVSFTYDGTSWVMNSGVDENSSAVTGVKGNSESSYRTGNVNLTAANIGAAASSHAHGDITSGGDITATASTIASGDKLIINDESESKITNGPAFGTSTTQFLANNGTWQTPAGTVYNDFTGATASAAGTHGLVPAPAVGKGNWVLMGGGGWVEPGGAFLIGAQEFFGPDVVGFMFFDNGEITADNSGTLMTSNQEKKLNDIEDGAEVNQNAFSNIKVGATTVAADGKTDTLELAAGSNISLTPDATNDKVTISASVPDYSLDHTQSQMANGHVQHNVNLSKDGSSAGSFSFEEGDTKNTAGSTDSSSKLFLIGATSQAASPQTYSQDTAYVGTDGHLYSDSKQVVNLSGSQALTNKTYNGYSLGAACAKSVDTSIAAGSTSTNLPTSAAVVDYVASQAAGAATFQGTLVASDTGGSATKWTQTELQAASYKKGWYWVCETAGTYAGNVLEAGDMLFCVSDKGSAYAASDFTAIQNNIETLTTTEIDALWTAA